MELTKENFWTQLRRLAEKELKEGESGFDEAMELLNFYTSKISIEFASYWAIVKPAVKQPVDVAFQQWINDPEVQAHLQLILKYPK